MARFSGGEQCETRVKIQIRSERLDKFKLVVPGTRFPAKAVKLSCLLT